VFLDILGPLLMFYFMVSHQRLRFGGSLADIVRSTYLLITLLVVGCYSFCPKCRHALAGLCLSILYCV